MLFYVALSGRSQSRLRLAGLLWPDKSDSEARVNLRQSLHLLRRALPGVVEAARETVGLRDDLAREIDTLQFETEMSQGLAGDIAALEKAAERYRGEFLEGFYVDDAPEFEEWALVERERLRGLMIQALVALSDHFTARQAISRGLLYTNRLLTLEPWREASYRQLMRLLAWDGQVPAALAQYERCRQLLADELGVEPAAETTALWEQIRAGALPQLKAEPPAVGPPAVPAHIVQWGDAPTLTPLYGRGTEMAQLANWLLAEKSRLTAILGMGGQGKTALAATFARTHAAQFDALLWRTLVNAPSLSDVVRNWLEWLAPEAVEAVPPNLEGRLELLFVQLARRSCLLVLDNAESIMEGGRQAGEFRAGYEEYDYLLSRFAEGHHQSCLLLTSREMPRRLARWQNRGMPVHALNLAGLNKDAGRAVLREELVRGSGEELETVVRRYSGNPLALILVADMIADLYDGDIGAFLAGETTVFDDIQSVLAQQFSRLTSLEWHIMFWLAVEREATAMPALAKAIRLPHRPGDLPVAMRSLQRRSLIERRADGFTLQNVVMEFTTDFLVSAILNELVGGEPNYLALIPLMKAQSRTFIRRAQERLLLKPVAEQLAMRFGNMGAVAQVQQKLVTLSPAIRRESYAGGNLLNLALSLGATEPLDFSGTAVWQVYLRGKTMPPIDFSGADFSGSDFTDYGGKIQTLAFSPDGRQLAGSAGTGDVRLWDAASYQLLATFEGHKDFAGGLCFSPDGRFLLSGGGDGVARLWDAETGARLHTFPAHDNAIGAVVYAPGDAPGGEWVAGISYNRLSFWDPQSGETLLDLSFFGGYLNALAVSSDGRMIALGNQRAVLVWDTAATLAAGVGRQLFAFQEHEVLVQRLAFSPDGKWLAASGDRICLWDLADGQLRHTFNAPNNYLLGLAFHPAGELLAGGSSDAIHLWRVQTGEMVHAFAAHEQRILSLAYSPDGKTLASASEDHTVRLWDAGCRNMHVIHSYVNMVHTLDISPDGRYLACGTEDQQVRLYDYVSGRILAAWSRHNSIIWRVAFSPDGSRLATCSRDRHVLEWAIPGGETVHRLKSGDARIASLVYRPNGRLLAVGDTRGAVTLWDVAAGRPVQTLAHPESICALAFHPQGDRVAVVCFTQEIFVWEAATGRLLQRFAGHDNETWALAYSRDGRSLVSGSDDQTVRIWDAETGECAHTLTGHTGWVQTLAFNRAGTLLATGSQDGRVGLWDVTLLNRGERPHLLRFLEGHTARVTTVLFAPDDAALVSGSLDETMRFWDPATGQLRQTWAIPGPYAGMDITGATGLSPAQRRALALLGAVERP